MGLGASAEGHRPGRLRAGLGAGLGTGLRAQKEVAMTDIDRFSRDLDELRARVTALQEPNKQQMAELTNMASLAFENLQTALEELQVADRELRQQNEQLAEAQIALEQERRRYQELFDFAPDGYITSDPLGVVQEANRAAGLMLNRPPQDLVGKPLAVFVAADDRRFFRTQLAQIAGAEQLDDWELRLVPRERQPFTAAISVAAVRVPTIGWWDCAGCYAISARASTPKENSGGPSRASAGIASACA